MLFIDAVAIWQWIEEELRWTGLIKMGMAQA
jgi:hypothetical protein